MKVKADHWVNHNGEWYAPGEEYETGSPVVHPLEPVVQPEPEPEQPQPAKRTRKRKSDE